MRVKTWLRSHNLLAALLLLVVSAAIYLPLVRHFGYYNDDWYLMYAARVRGAFVFKDIFSVDRPGRALVMIPAYLLFGGNPLYYNLSAYVVRVAGALCLLWLVRMLWPRQRVATLLMALLFLIYPGFLSQPNAIDYQSHLVGLALALLSIALTIGAVLSERKVGKVLLFAFAILSGWAYLSQMEYYISFEVLRFAAVFLVVSRDGGSIFQKSLNTLRKYWPLLVVPLFFLIWRLFFFHAERGATDIGTQLSDVALSPLATGLWWLVFLIQDTLNVLVLAWGVPLYQLGFQMRLSQTLMALGIAVFASAMTLLAMRWSGRIEADAEGLRPGSAPDWRQEAFWLGLIATVFSLVPVILVNRHVTFPAYSRYTLVGSASAAMVLVAGLYYLVQNWLRLMLVAMLVTIASLTHFANAVNYADATTAVQNFWWQVSWRAPQFWKGATLIAQYPVGAIEEDYFVWGPANQIYYPDGANERFVQPGIFAAVLNHDTVINVLTRQRQEFDNRRSIRTYKNYRNVVVLAQPTADSCVRAIDGSQPEFSSADGENIMAVAPYSEIDLILADDATRSPPEMVFGPQPPHGWCYYYEQATLARQRGDWGAVAQLGTEAQNRHLAPGDPIEWMPFLQAYLKFGDEEQLKALAPVVTADAFVAQQACQILKGVDASQPMRSLAESLYCLPN
jgi:hypothetical protein